MRNDGLVKFRLPAGHLDAIHEAIGPHGTVSSWLREAVTEKLRRDAARTRLEERHGDQRVFELHLWPASEFGNQPGVADGAAYWAVKDPTDSGVALPRGPIEGLVPEVEATAHMAVAEKLGRNDFRLEVKDHRS